MYIKTAKKLKGSDRRQFIVEVVKGLRVGGQTLVKRNWDGIDAASIKGWRSWRVSGQPIIDGFEPSGPKRVEIKLPKLTGGY